MFELHERLAADSAPVASLSLCHLRLARDARYPWAILIPQRAGVSELTDLAPPDQGQLMAEISAVSHALRQLHAPDRINVASLGNLVPQLHIHVVARFRDDAAWPGPIWGVGQAEPYRAAALEKACEDLKRTVLTYSSAIKSASRG